jgi:hypothetical protein
VLARISHECARRSTPSSALPSDDRRRFGALGNGAMSNMKGIRASGQQVLSIINDLLDHSGIGAAKTDLALHRNLNGWSRVASR